MQFTENFWTREEHLQNELPTKKHRSFTHAQASAATHTTHQRVNFRLTVNLVLLIKSITGTIFFPVLSQYPFASSIVRGVKGSFQSRKWNHKTIYCVYSYTFSMEDLARWRVNWRRREEDGESCLDSQGWRHRQMGPEKPPDPPHLAKIMEVTPELSQLLSKLAYLKRLAVFYLTTFPRFFQYVCFWNPESVSTSGGAGTATQPSVARCEAHEDLEYGSENNFHCHISFQLQEKVFVFWDFFLRKK